MICAGYSVIDETLLKNPAIIVFYGVAGSGKTNLLFQILRCSSRKDKKGIYVSTEGSIYRTLVEKWFNDLKNVLFTEAITEDDLIKVINILTTLKYRLNFVAIDTINMFYRLLSIDDISYALRFLSFIMAQLRYLANNGTYVLLAAQIREIDEEEIAGIKAINFWSDFLVKVDVKKNEAKRSITAELDNANLIVYFKITGKGIEWINHELIKRSD